MRSLSDTFAGQIQMLFVVIVGSLIGLIYLYFDLGAGDAMAEIP
ncbi:hypothetical protein [Octadecabacter ascidiaceicola]|nr:hypothetical protein [Octadecabacter ascidiaceicola]